MAPYEVDCVIVHYRSGGAVNDLLTGLATQADVLMQTFVVECGDDGSLRGVDTRHPATTVIDPGQNLGYCAGNNVGVAAGTAPYVLVANPDTRPVAADVVATLCRSCEENPSVAAAAPLIRTVEGRIEYADSVLDLDRAAAFLTMNHVDAWPYGAEDRVHLPWVSGAFWVFRRSALADVGPLDERFFLLCEEVDWCIRARTRGYELALVRDAVVVHSGGRSFRDSRKAAYYYGRNMFLLCRKHAGSNRWWSRWARMIAAPLVAPRTWLTAVPANALWGAFDALRGRYGPRPVRP